MKGASIYRLGACELRQHGKVSGWLDLSERGVFVLDADMAVHKLLDCPCHYDCSITKLFSMAGSSSYI
jgi:hypothetical protein